MTTPKPKMDWMKWLPVAIAAGGIVGSYATIQTQVNQAVNDIVEIKRTHAKEKDLDRHRRLSAHGSVARELGEAKTEIKHLERRIRSLERRSFSNGGSKQ